MEQDVEQGYSTVCATCLSTDRDLFSLVDVPQLTDIFRWLLYDPTVGEPLDNSDLTQLICWECLAMFKKVHRFKWQVLNAQNSLRVIAMSQHSLRVMPMTQQEMMDHTYISQSLSSLVMETKTDYDKIFFDYSNDSANIQVVSVGNAIGNVVNLKNEEVVRDSLSLDMDNHMFEVIDNSISGVLSRVVVDTGSFIKDEITNGVMPQLTIEPIQISSSGEPIMPISSSSQRIEKSDPKLQYIKNYMSESEMLAAREELKKKIQYVSSVYKCELCIIGFYTENQVEQHFENTHKTQPDCELCKICYVYVPYEKLSDHRDVHYLRFICKLCSKVEYSEKLIQVHMENAHTAKALSPGAIQIEGTKSKKTKEKKKKSSEEHPAQPGDLRKLLSKTTIEGYKCLECDMFFQTSRARKNHVARTHREGLQCDHCKKRFVNKTTLGTHLKLHEGPLPREECPICKKMVRSVQIKYHIQRHENKGRYECGECNKVFSHRATFQAHLKYSRAHASDSVFKFPCPMCNKGYPTKEAMQDHFNYQHLGRTTHKCPICNKPIASRANVEKHIARVHAQNKKEKPRNHVCQTCGKSFKDRKALIQHEVIHSGLRPLTCDVCQQSFKQKASLYTHKKRVHKIFPVKKEVSYVSDPTVPS